MVDLGSGGGKSCYIAAQIVGREGRVIGIDMNDDMLGLARKYQPLVAEKLGYDNVEFRKGRIQDLRLNRDRIDSWLQSNPVTDEASLRDLEEFSSQQKKSEPLIADGSVDVVMSNCVLNLVDDGEKKELFRGDPPSAAARRSGSDQRHRRRRTRFRPHEGGPRAVERLRLRSNAGR